MARKPSDIDREFEAAEREAFAEQARRFRALTDAERLAYFLRNQESEAWATKLPDDELRRALARRDRERDAVALRLRDALA